MGRELRASCFSPKSQWLCQCFLRLSISKKVNFPRRNRRVELSQAVIMQCRLICSWVRCSEDNDWERTKKQKLLKLQKELQAKEQIINDRQSWYDGTLRAVLCRS